MNLHKRDICSIWQAQVGSSMILRKWPGGQKQASRGRRYVRVPESLWLASINTEKVSECTYSKHITTNTIEVPSDAWNSLFRKHDRICFPLYN